MIIFDEKQKSTLSSITILLTVDEANQLHDFIEGIKVDIGDHIHVSDINFKKEITLAIYTDNNISHFSKNMQELIKKEQ